MLNETELDLLSRLDNIPRWVIVRTLQQQNTMEHSFRVLLISMFFLEHHHLGNQPDFKIETMRWAICHDMEESLSGDIPSPMNPFFKKGKNALKLHVGLRTPGSSVTNVVKCADILESLLFLETEKSLGNKGVDPIFKELMTDFEKQWEHFLYHDHEKPTAVAVFEYFSNLFARPYPRKALKNEN